MEIKDEHGCYDRLKEKTSFNASHKSIIFCENCRSNGFSTFVKSLVYDKPRLFLSVIDGELFINYGEDYDTAFNAIIDNNKTLEHVLLNCNSILSFLSKVAGFTANIISSIKGACVSLSGILKFFSDYTYTKAESLRRSINNPIDAIALFLTYINDPLYIIIDSKGNDLSGKNKILELLSSHIIRKNVKFIISDNVINSCDLEKDRILRINLSMPTWEKGGALIAKGLNYDERIAESLYSKSKSIKEFCNTYEDKESSVIGDVGYLLAQIKVPFNTSVITSFISYCRTHIDGTLGDDETIIDNMFNHSLITDNEMGLYVFVRNIHIDDNHKDIFKSVLYDLSEKNQLLENFNAEFLQFFLQNVNLSQSKKNVVYTSIYLDLLRRNIINESNQSFNMTDVKYNEEDIGLFYNLLSEICSRRIGELNPGSFASFIGKKTYKNHKELLDILSSIYRHSKYEHDKRKIVYKPLKNKSLDYNCARAIFLFDKCISEKKGLLNEKFINPDAAFHYSAFEHSRCYETYLLALIPYLPDDDYKKVIENGFSDPNRVKLLSNIIARYIRKYNKYTCLDEKDESIIRETICQIKQEDISNDFFLGTNIQVLTFLNVSRDIKEKCSVFKCDYSEEKWINQSWAFAKLMNKIVYEIRNRDYIFNKLLNQLEEIKYRFINEKQRKNRTALFYFIKAVFLKINNQNYINDIEELIKNDQKHEFISLDEINKINSLDNDSLTKLLFYQFAIHRQPDIFETIHSVEC